MWALLAIDRACDIHEEIMRKAFWGKNFIAWSLYLLVSKCVHVGGVRRQTKISFQHVGAAHISVAQVICIVIETVSQ